jgi:hypothetical protein
LQIWKDMYVTDGSQLAYFRRRLLQERDLAASATGEEARAVHTKMSTLYAARLTLSYVDEANSSVSQNRQRQTIP